MKCCDVQIKDVVTQTGAVQKGLHLVVERPVFVSIVNPGIKKVPHCKQGIYAKVVWVFQRIR